MDGAMSLLDRGNEWVTIYPEKQVIDRDGNILLQPDFDNPVRAWVRIQPAAQSGTSARRAEQASEGYETIGKFREFVKGFSDSPNATNPAKVGHIIDELYGAPEPPARMLVGVDAVTFGGYAADAQAASDEK